MLVVGLVEHGARLRPSFAIVAMPFGTLMSDIMGAPQDGNREAVIAYLAALSGDLAALAREHGLDTLGYILEMARLEAENTKRGFELP